MQTCGTCRYWQKPHGWNGDEWAGGCLQQGTHPIACDAFTVRTEESDFADLLTGPDFGCIKYAPSSAAMQAQREA